MVILLQRGFTNENHVFNPSKKSGRKIKDFLLYYNSVYDLRSSSTVTYEFKSFSSLFSRQTVVSGSIIQGHDVWLQHTTSLEKRSSIPVQVILPGREGPRRQVTSQSYYQGKDLRETYSNNRHTLSIKMFGHI